MSGDCFDHCQGHSDDSYPDVHRHPPVRQAAGRGDTDDSRERIAREVARAFGNDWSWCTEAMRELYRADADRALSGASPAARPAEPPGELREQIAEEIGNAIVASRQTAWEDLNISPRQWGVTYADRLLSGSLAPLLAARATVKRVEALAETWKRRAVFHADHGAHATAVGLTHRVNDLRRALGGPR